MIDWLVYFYLLIDLFIIDWLIGWLTDVFIYLFHY